MASSKTKYVLKILTDKNILAKRAMEVNPDEPVAKVKGVVNDIKRTLKANNNLMALSAPQLGYDKRIFGIKFADKIMIFVNPLITKTEGMHLSRETNASVNAEYVVPRPDYLTAMYQTEKGAINENKFEGAAAEMFEQMVQCLEGIYIDDFGLEILDGFDELSDEQRQEILSAYIQYLNDMQTSLDTEIKETPELYQTKRAMEFMESVAKGETEVVPEYDGEIDESESTKLRHEKELEQDKAKAERIKAKIEEIKQRETCL